MKIWGLLLSGVVLGGFSQVQASMKDLYEGIKNANLKKVQQILASDIKLINKVFDSKDIIGLDDELRGVTPLIYSINRLANIKNLWMVQSWFYEEPLTVIKKIINELLSHNELDPNYGGNQKRSPLLYLIDKLSDEETPIDRISYFKWAVQAVLKHSKTDPNYAVKFLVLPFLLKVKQNPLTAATWSIASSHTPDNRIEVLKWVVKEILKHKKASPNKEDVMSSLKISLKEAIYAIFYAMTPRDRIAKVEWVIQEILRDYYTDVHTLINGDDSLLFKTIRKILFLEDFSSYSLEDKFFVFGFPRDTEIHKIEPLRKLIKAYDSEIRIDALTRVVKELVIYGGDPYQKSKEGVNSFELANKINDKKLRESITKILSKAKKRQIKTEDKVEKEWPVFQKNRLTSILASFQRMLSRLVKKLLPA